ncbi:MAG TPA: ABC transporter substrate-binding protein [Thermomicrobiales bacterium]|nr:ABC transporter substrate-binding protein [Thermomicrobiales bacterium]
MSSNRPVGLLNQGIAAYHDNRLDDARKSFTDAVLADPTYDLGWIWFATVATDQGEQRYCIDRALSINPESPVKARLVNLEHVTATVPPELLAVHRPPLPDDLQHLAPASLLPIAIPAHRRPISTTRPATDASNDPPGLRQRLNYQWYHWVVLVLLPLLAIGAIYWTLHKTEPIPFTIAIVAPLTGPEASIGQEQVQAAQLAVDQINQDGGIDNNPVSLLVLDDGSDPDVALRKAQELSQNDDILFVIGHYDGASTNAASAVYEATGIPAINASEAANEIVGANGADTYFTVVLPSTNQGNFMAGYAREALNLERASIIFGPDGYGLSVAEAFATTFTDKGGTIAHRWDVTGDDPTASITRIVAELQEIDDPGIVVLAMEPHGAQELLIAAKRAGLELRWFGAPSLGYDAFPSLFASEPEEIGTPGYFTNGMLAASPLIYDSIGGPAMEFAQIYKDQFDDSPDWFGARVYDAMTIGSSAIELGNLAPSGDIDELRQDFTDALVAIGSNGDTVDGISSTLFFNPDHYIPRSLSVGHFRDGGLRSEPIQYRLLTDPDQLATLAADDAAGLVMSLPDGVFRQYQVVYTGIDINNVSALDTTNQTFDADFFIWLRYHGDIAATNITFANATDPTLTLGTPLQQSTSGDETYVMYRVQGEFAQPMNFRDYPWDQHVLRIAFGNTLLSDADIIYVADGDTLERTQAERLLSGSDQTRTFDTVPSWTATSVWYSQEPQITRSVVQDPTTGSPGYAAHSEFQIDMTFERTVGSFLVKELLPLALLSLVLWITLFFPTDQTAARTGFAITSILTCSVLLQGISGRLPAIGYTVAIEYWFYVFIFISAAIILLGIVIDRFEKAKRPGTVRHIEVAARIVYPVIIMGVALGYYLRFGMH